MFTHVPLIHLSYVGTITYSTTRDQQHGVHLRGLILEIDYSMFWFVNSNNSS